jgi:hypothetical protein
MTALVHRCCICHSAIPVNGGAHPLDPCALVLVANIDKAYADQKEQTFFCHFECFGKMNAMDSVLYIAEPNYSTNGEFAAERAQSGEPEEIDIPPRYEAAKSIEKITALFNLHTDPQMQDWALETSSPQLLDPLLDAYDESEMDDDDRFALMSLIVASLDDARHLNMDIRKQWARAAAYLDRDAHLHAHTMDNWSCGTSPDPDRQHLITPDIRRVWWPIKYHRARLGR